MTAQSPMEMSGSSASRVLGRKMDSIPFSPYQVLIIFILALVGFIEGYDLFMTGSLLVLAKAPLHLTGTNIQWLLLGPAIMGTIGGFGFSAVGDQLSRKAMLLIGVIATTFFTLLIPLVQNAEQLIILRSLTGLGAGGVWSAVYPIGAELMPAQHRRTYGAVYEMALASSFTVLPFVGGLLAGNPDAFRLLALPGGLALLVVPAIVFFLLPESPRWHLRRGGADRRRLRQPDHRAVRQSCLAADRGGARRRSRDGSRDAAALSALVRQRPAALDRDRRDHRHLRRLRCVYDCGAVAEGADQPGLCRQCEPGNYLDHLRDQLFRERLHRLADGDHRPALGDLLCDGGRAARVLADAALAYGGTIRPRVDDRGRADHRLHRGVGIPRNARLPVRAVPDGVARPAATSSASRSAGSSPAACCRFSWRRTPARRRSSSARCCSFP